MTRILIGKRNDRAAFTAALGDIPESAQMMLHGTFDCDAVEFVGIIGRPDARAACVGLGAPEPIPGETEGWLYFEGRKTAFYTEDLAALRIEA